MSVCKLEMRKCSGCSACAMFCPQKCICMKQNEEGFYYPYVNKEKCNDCGLCEKSCPALVADKQKIVLSSYAAINKDELCRKESSSGGIFYLLAKQILNENGAVFGAAMMDNCKKVCHIEVEREEELWRLQGSKYVQSEIGNIYVRVKERLNDQKKVLFSGTPCQIAGLKLYLRKEYENLLTVDVICHGVPSEKIWNRYVDYIEKKYHAKLKMVNFRYKQFFWQDFSMKRVDKYDREVVVSKNDDTYMKFFLKNYSLRESCYSCSCKENKYSDITLGDFWGIENIIPDMNDGMGTSAIIVRTEKGKNFLKTVKDKLKYEMVSEEDIVSNNSAECKSVCRPVEREYFYKDLEQMSYDKMIKKYVPVSLKVKIRKTVKRFFVGKIVKIFQVGGEMVNNSNYYVRYLIQNK